MLKALRRYLALRRDARDHPGETRAMRQMRRAAELSSATTLKAQSTVYPPYVEPTEPTSSGGPVVGVRIVQ